MKNAKNASPLMGGTCASVPGRLVDKANVDIYTATIRNI